MKCTRQRCHVAPTTRLTAAFSPSCASEITSLTPRRPRLVRRFRKPFEEGFHALVDFLAQFRDLALRDAGEPHRLRDLVDPARRHPANPGLLDDGDQRLFRRLARLQEWREVAASPQLRDLEGGGAAWP